LGLWWFRRPVRGGADAAGMAHRQRVSRVLCV